MKLCWDNIENIRLNTNGNFRDVVKNKTYYYHSCCKECGDGYLGKRLSKFCCSECADVYNSKRMKLEWNDNNSVYNLEVAGKISKTIKDMWNDNDSVYNTNEYKHNQKQGSIKAINDDRKSNMSTIMKSLWKDSNSMFHNDKRSKRISEALRNAWKDNNSSFNSKQYRDNSHIGYKKNGLAYYDTYAPQLDWCEEVRRNEEDPNILEVKCTYCGRWFIPEFQSINNRSHHLKGHYKNEYRLYCSKYCKKACPIYNKTPQALMREDAIRAGRLQWLELNREVQPQLRQMVLERDGYECVKCGSKGPLHCHHILPVATDPLESADIDNCITLCEECHKEAHRLPGCGYNNIKMEMC